jgi:MFS family permease
VTAETAKVPGPADRAAEASPWKDRSFLIFASGNTLNNIGEAIYAVALPLLVYDRTGSLAMMSVLAAIVPASLLLGPWLGVIADRCGSRVMVLPGLLLQAMAALALNLVGLGGHASMWLLFGLAAAIQLGGSVYQTGWMTGVATMFPACPKRARGTLSSLFIASRIVGALLFAVALPYAGYLGLLWINIATFFAPIAVWLLGIRPQRPQPSAARHRHILSDMSDGWRLLRGNRTVIHATIAGLPILFVSSVGTTTLATFDMRMDWHLGNSTVGIVLMARAISGLLGSLWVSQRRRLALRATLLFAAVGWVGCLIAMATHLLAVFVVALVFSSALNSAFVVALTMMRFKYLPAAVIGRASGLIDLAEGIPQLAAPLVIPVVSATVGVPGTFVVLAAVACVALAYLARTRSSWEPDEPPLPAAALSPSGPSA